MSRYPKRLAANYRRGWSLRIGGRNTANPHWVPRHGRETRQFACAAAVAVAVAAAAAVGDVAVAVAGSCVA